MKKLGIFIIALFTLVGFQAQTDNFNNLLQKHVNDKGNVDYKSFKKDEKKLIEFTTYLANTSPDTSWSANKEKAFWINAYNAYTIKLILENYPLESITDIKENGKTAWKIKFAKVCDTTYTLDQIEHEILRKKFKDPRIHVGVNCASVSCPKLLNKAFTENNIEAELEMLMKEFVNDSSRNKIAEKNIEISSVFDWFKEDFTMNSTVIEYLNRYSNTKIDKDANVSYLKYNWSLNEK
jgi:hypothetical protein